MACHVVSNILLSLLAMNAASLANPCAEAFSQTLDISAFLTFSLLTVEKSEFWQAHLEGEAAPHHLCQEGQLV